MTLPTGTATFLFTDIEGSTLLLQSLGERYGDLLQQHHRLLREVFTSCGGSEVGTEGDAFFVVFPSTSAAVEAAVRAQRMLADHDWGDAIQLRVRMGLHTGEAKLFGDDYGGIDVHRAARISSAAHGGQIIVSEATRALVATSLPDGTSIKDLGVHRLKDLKDPEHLYQISVDDLPAAFPPLKTLDARVHNLPQHLGMFIGREHEVDEISSFLTKHRMLTLTGPGGTGKTRLSIKVGGEVLDDFTDGVFFVPLAPISDPRLVPATIAETLGVRETGASHVNDLVRRFLHDKQMLLILDNFEQILDAAPDVSDLLAAAPDLRMLVTSRAPLRIYGEQEYPVPPLALPAAESSEAPDTLERYESVSLFVQRARSVKPDFRLTPENSAAVAEICTRLDGLPLAIELAAARIKVLGPHDILKRLKSSLSVLAGGARDLPRRQQTLRDAIAWSYDLLDDATRAFFLVLGVFAGGWTLEEAEAIAERAADVQVDALDALERLVENSLVRRYEMDTGETRYRMLQTIREYALEMLEAQDRLEAFREAHASIFVELSERAAPELTTTSYWLDRMTAEHDNIRIALQWIIANGRTELGLRIGNALWRFWQVRGHLSEGRQWLMELLEQWSGRDATRARALMSLGSIVYWQKDFEGCARHYREGLEIFRDLGDPAGIAEATYNLGFTYLVDRDFGPADELHRQSLALYAQLADTRGEANSSWALAMAAVLQERTGEARTLARDALARYEKLGDWFGRELTDFIFFQAERLDGRIDEARRMIKEILTGVQEVGDITSVASALESLADMELDQGYPRRAVKLAAAAEAMKEAMGAEAPPTFVFARGDPRELARGELGEHEIDAAWREGLGMSIAEAIAYAVKDPEDEV